MTVIVQPGTDSNGNPQPMVYDSDTGKVIVDSNGYVLNGGQRLVNIPSKTDYVSTAKTQTSGIQEAVSYAYSISIPYTDEGLPLITNLAPPIKLGIGTFIVNAEITIPYNLSVDIIGSGMTETVIDATSISGNVLYWNKSTSAAPINGGTYYTYNNKLSDFTLLTDNTSSTDYSVDLSQPEGAYRYTVERINLFNPGTALSLRMDGLEGSILENVVGNELSYLNPYGSLQLYHCVFNRFRRLLVQQMLIYSSTGHFPICSLHQ